MANDVATPAEDSPSSRENKLAIAFRRHPKYWLDDGSLVIRAQSDVFKVHRTLLDRHSTILSSLSNAARSRGAQVLIDGCPAIQIPDDLGVESVDFEALLEHLYHDIPLDSDASLTRVASVLRVSSKRQLDFPSIHQLARRRLENMFPHEPEAFFHADNPDVALTLAVEYSIYSIQKALFYNLATHSNLEHDEPDAAFIDSTVSQVDSSDMPLPVRPNLSPKLANRCKALLNELVAHFTPILFTVATAHHMACTDVFAETWMPLVITPALTNNGLCRPLETLQAIIELDWQAHGLCQECVLDKREEWRGEQRVVWEKMDEWLGLVGKQ
ncbi:hypothetical protein AcV5_006610 [Taiwanofungus camphoratus]|nr:hypothetical protein AcV5_006610 [Antrodia cinnamomea]